MSSQAHDDSSGQPGRHTTHHHFYIHLRDDPPAGGGSGNTTASGPSGSPRATSTPDTGSSFDWVEPFLGIVLVILVAGLLALFGEWIYDHFDDNSGNFKPTTIATILQSEGFNPNDHSLCGQPESVANGTAYKLVLNRGGACRHTVETTIPAEKIHFFRGPRVKQASATWVFNPKTYDTDGVKTVKAMALGDQLKVDLHHLVVRLPSKPLKLSVVQHGFSSNTNEVTTTVTASN